VQALLGFKTELLTLYGRREIYDKPSRRWARMANIRIYEYKNGQLAPLPLSFREFLLLSFLDEGLAPDSNSFYRDATPP